MRPLVLFCLLPVLLVDCTRETKPPNVVLILTDDQGYGDIGAHGSPYVKTPAMDKLHDQAICFTNFHVDPCCAPTRSALLTGRYSSRTGVWHTIGGRSLLGTDNVTIAEVFKNAGYRTAIFGKWHLGENYPFRPMDRGFEESVIHGGGGIGSNPDYAGNDYYDDVYRHNGVPEQYSGYCNTVWFTEAMKFIRQHQEEPFFCYVATNVPHAPLRVDSVYSNPFTSQVSERLSNYYGMVTKLDEDLGIFLNGLDELKLADNTILIFMTDNGPCPWFGGIIIDEQGFPIEGYSCGMRGGKIWGYENAHRVPCYIRWPAGHIDGGREISKLAAHMDILPSLIDWCGLETPENADFDGVSLNNLIFEPEEDWPDRTLFVHNQRVDIPVKYKEYQVMTEKWRLLSRDTLELYNILEDPGQTTDLSWEYPEVVQSLAGRYEKWWDHISVDFDKYNAIIPGDEKENPMMMYSHDEHRGADGKYFWVADFENEGSYEFRPYLRPKERGLGASGPGVKKAVLRIGEELYEWLPGDDGEEPIFSIHISPGQTQVGAWFEIDTKTPRAYSLEVTFKPND